MGIPNDLINRQLKIEEEALEASLNKAHKLIKAAEDSGDISRLPEGHILLKLSITKVTAKFEELFKTVPKINRYLGEYEHHIDVLAYTVVVAILRELIRNPVAGGPQVIKGVCRAIIHGLGDLRLKQREDNLQEYVKRRFKKWSSKRREEERLKIIKHLDLMKRGDLNDPMIARFTSYLIDAVLASGANIVEKRLVHNTKFKTRISFTLTSDAYKIIMGSRNDFTQNLLLAPIFVIPPRPWESFRGTGGYYTERSEDDLRNRFDFTAIKRNYKSGINSAQLLERYFEANPEIRDATLGGLNRLSETKWRVNRKVLEVMDYVFTNSIQDPTAPFKAPRLIGKLPIFDRLDVTDYVKPEDIGGIKQPDGSYKFPSDSRGWRDYFIERDAVIDHVEANKSRALSTALALNIAKLYEDYDNLYFTYQYDYRGRVYPLQSHLNPIGNDPTKALLQFAEGQPLDSREALEWFLVHGANCYGYDKLPFEDRKAKITEMQSDIVKIADDPMRHRDVWNNAEEPWQFLAWCFEYAAYLKDNSHPIRTAVALDASCSGIQIYSGLLKDAEGAEATNVIGNSRNDLYQQVADRVEEMLRDGEYPHEIVFRQSDNTQHTAAAKPIADSLKGHITRSLVKQPVMTVPYAVSPRGIKEQLTNRLDELEANNNKFWIGDNWKVALFLTGVVQQAITDVVKGSRIGQEYLQQYARDIGKRQKYIFYNSPMNSFPVILATSKYTTRKIETLIGTFSLRNRMEEVNVQKLAQGIAPNFIHSLDSALLMETVNRLNALGITDYHLVHDSYGVHPNNVKTFNKVVREVYVEIFEGNPLQSLVDQTWPDYENRPESVMMNTLNLSEVLESEYIFS